MQEFLAAVLVLSVIWVIRSQEKWVEGNSENHSGQVIAPWP